jgi:23S rRNA (adenine1618-N6)-methyltransferase
VYGWQFVGSETDADALSNAKAIVQANDLSEAIELRTQTVRAATFSGVIKPNEQFDLTLCNPPFHATLDEAREGTQRKWRNLGKTDESNNVPTLNFGGLVAELCCAGGEEAFARRMVADSARHPVSCLWFTTLVSKAASLPGVYRAIKKAGALDVRTINMAQGQKKSRIVAWTFLDQNAQRAWREARWK